MASKIKIFYTLLFLTYSILASANIDSTTIPNYRPIKYEPLSHTPWVFDVRVLSSITLNTSQDYLSVYDSSALSWRKIKVNAFLASGGAATYWSIGGNSTGTNADIGITSSHRLGVMTNSATRVYFDASGRFVSGTLTDINLAASDSIRLASTTVDIAGAIKLTGVVAHVGDIDLNSYDLTEVNKMTSDTADIDVFMGTTKWNGAMNINGNNINNAWQVNTDSCNVLNGAFENAPTFNYQNYTATGTLNRELAHYWDGTSDDTLTTNTALPDETPFFVKNNDASLLLTILAGSGHTMNGDGRIYAGEGCWFQRHGTVIERITPFRHDYRADLSPTTDSNGDFTITHNLGTSNVVYFLTPICDACRYSFRRKTTSGITSNTIVIRVYDESTGSPLASTSLSVSAMVQRIN